MPRDQGKRQSARQSTGERRGGLTSTFPEGREGRAQGQGQSKGRFCDGTSGGGKQRGRGNRGR